MAERDFPRNMFGAISPGNLGSRCKNGSNIDYDDMMAGKYECTKADVRQLMFVSTCGILWSRVYTKTNG